MSRIVQHFAKLKQINHLSYLFVRSVVIGLGNMSFNFFFITYNFNNTVSILKLPDTLSVSKMGVTLAARQPQQTCWQIEQCLPERELEVVCYANVPPLTASLANKEQPCESWSVEHAHMHDISALNVVYATF